MTQLMGGYSKVLIVCPGNAMTAGPEALHQLGADLIRLGQPAAMVYYPFDRAFETPGPYQKYRVPVEPFRDEAGAMIVFPEIFPTFALKVRRAQAAIWWMSVNNYTCVRYGNPLRDKFRYFKQLVKGLRPWGGIGALGHLVHLAQSHYATAFLERHGIRSLPLSDAIPVYTAPDYLAALPARLAAAHRQPVILYNPTKGAKITARLMAAYPEWQFKPLRGLNREQLAEAFLAAMIYMDFGHHPGKDRLPREAAMHGCCIITGLYGSAADPVDVPIPPRYKLDDRASSFVGEFGAVVTDVFAHFDARSREFDAYRAVIHQEQIRFDRQIRDAFGLGDAH